MTAFSEHLFRHRLWYALLSIVLCLVLMQRGGLLSEDSDIGFATDYRIFFDEDDPQRQAMEAIEQEFTKSYTLVYILEALDGDLITAERLQALQWLTDKSWRLEHVQRVNSLSNYQHTSADGDDLWVEDLFYEPADYDSEALQRVRDIALSEPELAGRLISHDAQVAPVIAQINIGADDNRGKEALMRDVRELAAEFEQRYPDILLRIHGQLAIDIGIAETAAADSAKVESLMFLVLLLLLAVLMRSVWAMLASFVVMLVTVTATLGFIGWVYGSFNAINLAAPYIALALSILDCVHVLSAYAKRLSEGMDKHSAMRASLAKNLEAMVLTTATTAIGFAATNLSDSPPFREYGTATAFGVVFALLTSLTILPLLMMWFPAKVGGTPPMNGFVRFLQRSFERSHERFRVLGFVVLGLMIPLALSNNTDDRILDAFGEDDPLHVNAAFLEERLSGYNTLEFSLHADGPGGVTSPEFLQEVDRFSTWLEAQAEVIHVSGFHRVIKRLNKSMNGDAPSAYRIPEDRRAAAEYVLVYESNVPEELDLNDSVNVDKSALRLLVYTRDTSTLNTLEFNQRSLAYLEENGEHIQAYSSASPAMMFAYVGINNIRSMLISSAMVAGFVCLCLIVAFRSVRFGLYCMIPNLMPAVIALGVCGLVLGEINMGASMVFGMSLGIVVDDTIHFIVSYRRHRAAGDSPMESVQQTYSLVGRAVLITSITLIVGMAIPALFAGMKINVVFYSLMVLCVFIALIADLLFLPALLLRIDKNDADWRA